MFFARWRDRCRHHDRLGLAGVWIVLVHWLTHDRLLLLHHHLITIGVVRVDGSHLARLGHHHGLLLWLHLSVRIAGLNVHHLLLLLRCVVSRGDNDIIGIACVRVLASGDHCLTVHFMMCLCLTGLSSLNSSDHAYNSDDNTNAAGDGEEDVEEDYGSDSLAVIIVIIVVVV